jgi:hypothetical protein
MPAIGGGATCLSPLKRLPHHIRTLDPGPWTLDPGPWTPDPGPRTPDPGPRTLDKIKPRQPGEELPGSVSGPGYQGK